MATIYYSKYAAIRRFIINRMRAAQSPAVRNFWSLLGKNAADDIRRACAWLDARAEALHHWAARLTKARSYGARHKRRIFVTSNRRIVREKYVSKSTPIAQRAYDDDTQSFRAFLTQKRREQKDRDVYAALWQEQTVEVVARMQSTRRNAELVLSGAEGPLLP
jgi:hypothetical protein